MQVGILLGNGYEEIEALTVVDYLRRANVSIDMISITGDYMTMGDHNIPIKADILLEDISSDDYDVIVTPGGMPGAKMLAGSDTVIRLLQSQYESGGYIASICASPLALEAAGITEEITGTCFPGLETDDIHFGTFKEDLVVHDKKHHVITSRGPATAVYFALELIGLIAGEDKRQEIADGLLIPLVESTVKDND